ncbi:MAG: hypothetical protein CM15mP128_4460 [Methanobacteriota archaeon]|nr:MAG: hypothetical protein CM15mP128_4460 [Euryarchaeota archaeon]
MFSLAWDLRVQGPKRPSCSVRVRKKAAGCSSPATLTIPGHFTYFVKGLIHYVLLILTPIVAGRALACCSMKVASFRHRSNGPGF